MVRPLFVLLLLGVLGCPPPQRDPVRPAPPDAGPGPAPDGCGDGVLDEREVCDPGLAAGPGACPGRCDDAFACTRDSLVGSASLCTARCATEPITACAAGDGCCPAGCSVATDADCAPSATCGNGRLDPGETCDGDCPASCESDVACLPRRLVGNAANCTAACVPGTPVTECRHGDGCCPSGCTRANDDACEECETRSCQELGVECGVTSDGCDGTQTCPACTGGRSCESGRCVTVAPIVAGKACTSDGTCGGGWSCITEAAAGWDGGYCIRECTSDNDCGSGGTCALQNGAGTRFCARACTLGGACRSPGYACKPIPGAESACLPAGTGTGAPGAACVRTSQCGGGEGVRCGLPADGFVNGFCRQPCDGARTCPAGSHCGDVGSSGDGLCLPNCTSSCRAGYTCADHDGAGTLECYVSGTGTGVVGAPCGSVSDCAGGAGALCATSWPSGYCTVRCDASTPCPTEASACELGTGDGGKACALLCPNGTECRDGYICAPSGTSDVCIPPG